VLLKGVKIGGGEMLPGHYLAMNPGTATETLRGVPTTEPAFGLPATWISEDKQDRAQMLGYAVVDCTTVMATHLGEIIKQHAYELLGRQEAQNLLDNLGKTYPKLVEELMPGLLSLGVVMRVLQNLLREQVSIRDMRSILETLADYAPTTKDADLLTEYVRQAMGRSISTRHVADGNTLPVLVFDHEVESKMQNALQQSPQGSYLALDPATARLVLEGLSTQIKAMGGGAQPVLLCAPTIRPHVKRLTERYLPNLVVLSHNEIASHLKVKSVGTVRLNAS
jgi:flagellar biosynthesis protein FlhA